jgi:hypothetical protein
MKLGAHLIVDSRLPLAAMPPVAESHGVPDV